MVRLLIPRDLPWLFPYRTRWFVAGDLLFALLWSAGLFESLSTREGFTVRDPLPGAVLHGLVLGLVPALSALWFSTRLSPARRLGVTMAGVLLWLLLVRYWLRPHVFILHG